jgi:DNA-binding NarL/FixJ family response regulator
VIEVILVDDHPPVRAGIVQTLEHARDIRVVGEANDGHEMFSVLRRKPSTDVLLLDVEMPDFRVYEAVSQLRAQFPHLKILIVTAHNERSRILKLVDLGVRGYMLKDEPLAKYPHAIRQVAEGGMYFSSSVAHVAIMENGKEAILLTPREHEVLTLVAVGLASPAIGLRLGIAPKTVDKYAERASRKLGTSNRITAVLRAIELNLIKVPAGEDRHEGE